MLLLQQKYKNKGTMKSIIRKSHQKLTELLEKKKDATDSFRLIENTNNEESSIRCFENTDECFQRNMNTPILPYEAA